MTYEEFKRLFDICCTICPELEAEKSFIRIELCYEHYTDEDFISELEDIFFDEEIVEKAIKMFFEAA